MERSVHISSTTDEQKKQGLIDCYRIALDFGLAAGNLAAEQVRLQESQFEIEDGSYSIT